MNSSVPNASAPILSKRHRKFCDGILVGGTRSGAYAAAYPLASAASVRSLGSRLLRRPHIRAELARLRGKAAALAGPNVMSLHERRAFLARVVRLRRGDLKEGRALGVVFHDDGSWEGICVRDKLMAIKLDSKLEADSPAVHKENAELAAFHDLVRQIRAGTWCPQKVASDAQIPDAEIAESAPSTAPAGDGVQSAAGPPRAANPANSANATVEKSNGSNEPVKQPIEPPDPPARPQTLQEFLDERHAAVMAGRPPGGDTPVPVPAWRRRGFRTASSGRADSYRIGPLPYILPQDQGDTPLYFFAEPGRRD